MGKVNKALGIKNKTIFERLISSKKEKTLLKKLLIRFLNYIIKILEKFFSNELITYHIRPRNNKVFHTQPSVKNNLQCGILMQGPIDLNKNFTLETIKIYKRLYQNTPIILSTWDDEDRDALDQIQNHGVEIVTTKKPKNKAFNNNAWKNIDLQIISVKEGIKAFSKYDLNYCLKTRTDQRFYKSDLINYFLNLINAFPIEEGSIQKERIISSSFATVKSRVYGLTDMMMFAEISDLKRYWNVENYSTGIYKYTEDKDQNIPPIISGTLVGPEVYLMGSYLKEIGIHLEWNLNQYWETLGKYFLIVDSNSMDMYWNKYNKENEYKYARTYEQNSHRLIDFSDWLQIWNNNDNLWDSLRDQERWERSDDGKLSRVVI